MTQATLAGATSGAGSVAFTVSVPSGTVNGDLLIAIHASDWGTVAGNSIPAGFTAMPTASYDGGTNALHVQVGYRIASSEPASYTFPVNGGADAAGCILRITGADSTPTIAQVVPNAVAEAATNAVAPSVTPNGVDDLLVCWAAVDGGLSSGPVSWTPPTGMTERVDAQSGNFTTLTVATLEAPSSPSSTKTFTPTGGNTLHAGRAGTFSIKGATGGGGGSGTATKTFTFATDTESFVATTASGTTGSWDSTIGNPAGSLKMRRVGRNLAQAQSYWEWTGTWEQLGVPAGSTVNSLQLTSGWTRISEYATAASSVVGPYELRDSAGTLIGTLWPGRTATGTDAGVAIASQTVVTVPGHASSTTVKIRLADSLATGANNSAAISAHDDQVALSIGYAAAVINVALTGVVADLTTAAPNGTVAATGSTDVALTGAVAPLSTSAPVGSAALVSNVDDAAGPANLDVAAPAGTVIAAGSVALTGAAADLALTASAGTVTAASSVTLTGALADVTLTAPTGSLSTAVALTGVTSDLATAAPDGAVATASNVDLPAESATLAVATPLGAISVTSNVDLSASTTDLAVAAPGGSVTVASVGNVSLVGDVGNLTTTAPAGTVTPASVALDAALTGAPSDLAVTTPPGTLDAASTTLDATLTGQSAPIALVAPSGGVDAASSTLDATFLGEVSALDLAALAGDVAAVSLLEVVGESAGFVIEAPVGTIRTAAALGIDITVTFGSPYSKAAATAAATQSRVQAHAEAPRSKVQARADATASLVSATVGEVESRTRAEVDEVRTARQVTISTVRRVWSVGPVRKNRGA